ncbi:MAG: hypothetical protein ACREDD_09010 [Methylocella sp.]
MHAHVSFASIFHAGKSVAPKGTKFWKYNGGPYDYPHSGFAWCWVREILDKVGGLFELGGMGSGDHHMALGIAGLADYSIPEEIGGAYRDAVKLWESRALVHVNRNLGYVPGTIEHRWHGDKTRRAYISRWDMFIKNQFNPQADLKRNSYGVLEFSGNKPDLERMFDNYLRDREEDSNIIG